MRFHDTSESFALNSCWIDQSDARDFGPGEGDAVYPKPIEIMIMHYVILSDFDMQHIQNLLSSRILLSSDGGMIRDVLRGST